MLIENKCALNIVEVPENRYSDLLESETRLAVIEDYLRCTNYVDKNILKIRVGISIAKYDENISEKCVENFSETEQVNYE